MNRTLVIVLVLVFAVCAAVCAQYTQGPPGGMQANQRGNQMRGGTCPAMAIAPPPAAFVDRADALQLSDEQKGKLKAVLTKSEEDLKALRPKAAEATRALREALFAAASDQQKLTQLATDAAKADATVLNAEVQTWVQIRGILTADQLAQLQKMLNVRPAGGFGGRRTTGGPGGGNPPPPGPAPEPPPPAPGQ